MENLNLPSNYNKRPETIGIFVELLKTPKLILAIGCLILKIVRQWNNILEKK